ncbi:MAG: hypothetical protein EXX96DRAFT_620600 [Benjaminiella poitrasii]|nr:MAG: hypothetical protein EXX96DRAFT_620600 [Benjaminiella poitrasii]
MDLDLTVFYPDEAEDEAIGTNRDKITTARINSLPQMNQTSEKDYNENTPFTNSFDSASTAQSGYQLQFTRIPSPWRIKPMKRSLEDQLADELAINQFVKAGIIRVSPTLNKDYLSNFFTIQETSKR